jgi:hypothetical protein
VTSSYFPTDYGVWDCRGTALCGSVVALLAEEVDPLTGRMLGNFPQAYSRVGPSNSALNLSRQTGPAEACRIVKCVRSMRDGGAAEMIGSAIGGVILSGGKPANARLVAAAIRDTREVSASFFLPQDRARLIERLRLAARWEQQAITRTIVPIGIARNLRLACP